MGRKSVDHSTVRGRATRRSSPAGISASVPTHSFSTRLDLLQHAAGAGVLLENAIGFGGPLEGLEIGIALGNPGLDCSYQFVDALEYAATDALTRDLREQALDEVDPGR